MAWVGDLGKVERTSLGTACPKGVRGAWLFPEPQMGFSLHVDDQRARIRV